MDMDTDDMLKDDYLADLIRRVPLESPSEDFIKKVMAGIEPLPAPVTEKRPSLIWLKWGLSYVALGAVIVIILYTSDIPYLNSILGRDYSQGIFSNIFLPFFLILKGFLSSKFVSYALLIGVSAGFLFLVDMFLSRKLTTSHLS
jgi:hypothetical protein